MVTRPCLHVVKSGRASPVPAGASAPAGAAVDVDVSSGHRRSRARCWRRPAPARPSRRRACLRAAWQLSTPSSCSGRSVRSGARWCTGGCAKSGMCLTLVREVAYPVVRSRVVPPERVGCYPIRHSGLSLHRGPTPWQAQGSALALFSGAQRRGQAVQERPPAAPWPVRARHRLPRTQVDAHTTGGCAAGGALGLTLGVQRQVGGRGLRQPSPAAVTAGRLRCAPALGR